MRLALVQFAPQFPGRDHNWTRMAEWADQLNADAIVFPELASCGYCYRDAEELRPYESMRDALAPLADIARKRSRLLVGGFAERDGEACYNLSLIHI